ncbi:hypothetical protein UA08_09333 [Talaromyces atroroseus]|uniref:Uncharacterized protein n=1 Tax=Talaromyces atroroseus TaxID=1441469 RepID=A0A1Q5Q653_TALAT|nr:hypothetical protein UA08_09333 [Talaromyces atroroseus]OKL55349.1 hypothetical protein UA08_09333 [Talaromyces atroroseus]
MNIDRPPTYASSVPTSNAPPSAAVAAAGYSYNEFLQGQSLQIRSVAGDPSEPWLRTVNRIVAGVGIGLSTNLLIMRIYTKAKIMRKFWWDDAFITLAWS